MVEAHIEERQLLPNGILSHPSWTMYDSSKVQAFMECPRKYFYRYVLGWDNEQPSIHLIFGEGWHRAMAILLREGYTREAVEQGYAAFEAYYRESFGPEQDELMHPKSPGGALSALIQYAQFYAKIDHFKVLFTEVAGSVPINEVDRLSFRLDALVEDQDGKKLLEHKTGSRNDNAWSAQWRLSMQVRTYTHVMNCLYPPEEIWGALINGTFFYKDKCAFLRVPVRTSIGSMNAWLFTANYWVGQIKGEHQALEMCSPSEPVLEAFPMNTCNCTKYGICQHMDHCEAWANPLQHLEHRPTSMVERWWDPAKENEKGAQKVVHISLDSITQGDSVE